MQNGEEERLVWNAWSITIIIIIVRSPTEYIIKIFALVV